MGGSQHEVVGGGPRTGRSSQSEPHMRTQLVVQDSLVCGSWVAGRILLSSDGVV